MEPTDPITSEYFHDVLAAQLNQASQVLIIINAVVSVLRQQRLLPPDLMTVALAQAESSEDVQKLRSIIAKLKGHVSVEDILKDFEGPIQ
jgi:hypothetical protein